MTVACVLRMGGDFDPLWVWALKRGLSRWMPAGYEFVCLTDAPGGMGQWGRRLQYGWPKWWSKMELFRPGLFDGPVLYMDLDTLPVGDLSDLAGYTGQFAMISDLLRKTTLQSGVLAFTPGPLTWRFWEQWSANPAGYMKRYRGDGEWLAVHVPKADRLQNLYPGQIVSLKRDAKKAAPPKARLVCGHGRPRLSDPTAGWAHKAWKSLAVREDA